MDKNYYTVLGVPRNATSRQVRARFLELARTRHPDRFAGEEKDSAESEFQEITQAFNVLSDPDRRRQFDAALTVHSTTPKKNDGQAARVYLQRGIKAYKEKNYLQAAENFDRATRDDPASARAWHYLATACRHQQRWHSRARSAITKACELEPMNTTYLRLAGQIFAESGMSKKAEKYLNEALTWGGEDAEIREALDKLRGAASTARVRIFGKS